jgi:hypothetical protein
MLNNKKESGFAMIITLAFLVIVSFGFIITNNTTYSNIKNDSKNQKLKEINVFQDAILTSLYNNKWVPEGQYYNQLVCERFGCIKNTNNTLTVANIACPENNCYSVTITTNYNSIEISNTSVFK